ARSEAILVGSNTIRLDNPHLTVRDAPGRNPLRVIPSSRADLPLNSHVFTDGGRTLVAVSDRAPISNVEALRRCGVDVVKLGEDQVDLVALLDHLGAEGVTRSWSKAERPS